MILLWFELNLEVKLIGLKYSSMDDSEDLNEILIHGGPAVALEFAKLHFCSCCGNHCLTDCFRKDFGTSGFVTLERERDRLIFLE